MIDKKLQERVDYKRGVFMDKIKQLGIATEYWIQIEELSLSMEKANVLGESALASEYKRQIKQILRESMSA